MNLEQLMPGSVPLNSFTEVGITLQRRLELKFHFSLSMGKVSTVVIGLDPFNHGEEGLNVKNPHGNTAFNRILS
jgi:hypothetical protein